MKPKIKIIYLSFLTAFVFAACEKIIRVDLAQAEQKIVVDAVVSNLPGKSVVVLSKSIDLFSEQEYPYLSNAKVTIWPNIGEEILFEQVQDGIYQNRNFVGEIGVEYHLMVEWNEYSIDAKSIMPAPTQIDSVEVVVSERGFMGNEDISYALKVHFTDALDRENFYRFDVYRNDSLFDGFVVSSDLFYNGLSTYQYLMNYDLNPLDVIRVQLSAIDKANYNYFLVLSQSNSVFNIAPGNPVSNLTGNAIGFFGAYGQSEKTITIPLSE
jgi:hypothetical protein